MGKNTLTQQLIQDILDYIQSHNMKAGDFLPTEEKMREIFNISRVSLREACSYLKGIGIITSRRGSGFRISEGDFVATLERVLKQISYFDKQHFAELLELRKTLETGSIYNAVLNAEPKDIAKIFAAVDKMDELIKVGKVGTLEYNAADAEFHQAIIAPAECRTLGIINTAVAEFFKAMEQTFPRKAQKDVFAIARRSNLEHRQIAAAFKLRRPEAALLALAKHLVC
ncbi:MAG: FadR family transcriptional regulator [Victivallaceae bacterium]|nr:FadR family transcriptional regulator [Victivallaceae bacterium]